MKPYRPERIIIERGVEESPITRTVLANLPEIEVERVDSSEGMVEAARISQPSLATAKRSLVLARQRGRFFKPCPGQQAKCGNPNLCCDYFVINFAANCPMECSYCFLQSYLTFPAMVVYANLDDLLEELRVSLEVRSGPPIRVGTGELTDSLALDPITGYSHHLVEFFRTRSNAILELKTKTDFVDELIGLEHGGRTVVAWSLNPPEIQRLEEHKTASMEARLDAARRCVESGYRVAFHFDPMVHYPDWKDGYRKLVRMLFESVPSASVAWISLGGLRMPPEQREIMKERFPRSILPFGELVPAADGKLRYFKPIRLELYRRLSGWIMEFGGPVPVYACMERPELWVPAFGRQPRSWEELGTFLATGEGFA